MRRISRKQKQRRNVTFSERHVTVYHCNGTLSWRLATGAVIACCGWRRGVVVSGVRQ